MKLTINKNLIVQVDNNKEYKFIKYMINNNYTFKLYKKGKDYSLYIVNSKILEYESDTYKIVKYTGIYGIYNSFINNYIIFISVFIQLILLIVLTNTCFGIRIYGENTKVNEILIKELSKNDIKKYSFKKDYNKIEKIKNKILKDNSDSLQWLEIEETGVYYNIYYTPRKLKEETIDNTPQNIVASKDGVILSILKTDGVVLNYINDYVKKNDVIISGDIYINSKYIKSIKADGKVYAEVWYIASAEVPSKFIQYVKTDKVVNSYYIKFGKYKFNLIGFYKDNTSFVDSKIVFEKFYLPFKIIKQVNYQYKYEEVNLNNDQMIEEAIKRADSAINANLSSDEYILDKKVLNISAFSSKINVEIFYKVYEDITQVQKIEREEISEGNSNKRN